MFRHPAWTVGSYRAAHEQQISTQIKLTGDSYRLELSPSINVRGYHTNVPSPPALVSRVRRRGVHVLLRGPRALPAVLAVPLRLRLAEGLPRRLPLRRLPGDVHARRRCKPIRI